MTKSSATAKSTVEAYMKSANAAGKGAETLHNEIYSFSKQSVEDSIAAMKAVLGSKSAHEVFELQTDFAKSAFDAYVGQIDEAQRDLHFHQQGSNRTAAGPRPGMGRNRPERARRVIDEKDSSRGHPSPLARGTVLEGSGACSGPFRFADAWNTSTLNSW